MTLRIRLIVLAVAVVCMVVIGLQVRRREMRAKYLVLWATLCLLAVPLVAFPTSVDRVSEWLGIYYPPATLLLAATLILFLVSIHFSREISRLEERTRALAEELALMRTEPPADASRARLEVTGEPALLDENQRPPVAAGAAATGAFAGVRTPDA